MLAQQAPTGRPETEALEIDTEVHKTVEAPLPGNIRINFSDIQDACAAIPALAEETMQKQAA